MEEYVRVRVVITGRVQGVWFRVETKTAAEARGVNGWVRNEPDGSVAGVFEGLKPNVDRLLEWCRQGPPRARVDDVQLQWEPYQGQFEDFRITHI